VSVFHEFLERRGRVVLIAFIIIEREVNIMIKVVNIRDYKGGDLIRIDRSSVLGNPIRFNRVCIVCGERHVDDEEGRRNLVGCYKIWLWKVGRNIEAVSKELNRLEGLALERDLVLGCWCKPKQCHGDVIKSYLDWRLRE